MKFEFLIVKQIDFDIELEDENASDSEKAQKKTIWRELLPPSTVFLISYLFR